MTVATMKTLFCVSFFVFFGAFTVALSQDAPKIRSRIKQDDHGISFHSSAKGTGGKMARLDFRAKFHEQLQFVLNRRIREEHHVQTKEKFIIDFVKLIIFQEGSPGQCEVLRTCRTNGFQPDEDEVVLESDFKDLPIQFDDCTEKFDRALGTYLHTCNIFYWPPAPYSFGDPYFNLTAQFADASYYYGKTPIPAEGIVFSLSFSFPFQMQGNPGLYFALKIGFDAKVHTNGPEEAQEIDFDLAAFLYPPFATITPSLEEIDVFPTFADDNSMYFAFAKAGGLQDVVVCWGSAPCARIDDVLTLSYSKSTNRGRRENY